MAFPLVTLEDRSRHYVRGRVLVFTDSTRVEFLEESLKYSFPMFSNVNGYPDGFGLVFLAELHGYLSFDAGSDVHITEVANYEKFWFDPSGSSVVCPASTFLYKVDDYESLTIDPQGFVLSFRVYYNTSSGAQMQDFTYSPVVPATSFTAFIDSSELARGKVWKGKTQYQGFTPL